MKLISRIFLTLAAVAGGAFLLCVIAVAVMLFVPIHSTDTDISRYDAYREDVSYGMDFMPELAEVTPYEDIRFVRYWKCQMFESETLGLFVQYSAEDYPARKAEALAREDFLADNVINRYGELLMAPQCTYQGYDLRTVALSSSDAYACKQVGLIGTNDESRVICYLLFEDVDLDYIGEAGESPQNAMHDWLEEYFLFPNMK